jgi:hypothetical protein
MRRVDEAAASASSRRARRAAIRAQREGSIAAHLASSSAAKGPLSQAWSAKPWPVAPGAITLRPSTCVRSGTQPQLSS